MKRRHILIFFMLPLLMKPSINAKIITFFVKRYPQQKGLISTHLLIKKATKLKIHSTVPHYILRHLLTLSGYIGILATYTGYIVHSNHDGQIMFPKEHQEPFVDLIITRKIVPVMLDKNIVHHWEIPPNTLASAYRIERKNDAQTNLFFWQTTPQSVPADGKIGLKTIVLFAKPENIYVPTGITITEDDPNFILPTLYIKKGFDSVENALQVLYLRQLFETPQPLYKNTPYGYAQQLATLK